MEYYSTKKNEIKMPLTAMPLENLLSEVIQKEKDEHSYHIYTECKIWHKVPIYKTEAYSWTKRLDLCLSRGREEIMRWTWTLGLVDANYYIYNR